MGSEENGDVLYHASATSGLKVFMPRRCWFNPGLNLSGVLEEGARPPDGCIVKNCVFAGDARFVSYFCVPHQVKRFSLVGTSGNCREAMGQLGFSQDPPGEVMVFEEREKEQIRNHRFSVYAFRKSDFVRFPSGEYAAGKPVVPLSEVMRSNPLDEMRRHGIHAVFVADIEGCFSQFLKMDIRFGIVSNIVGARYLLDKERGKQAAAVPRCGTSNDAPSDSTGAT